MARARANVLPPAAASDFPQRSVARWWLLALLLAINAANFADRTIVGALGQAIKADLKISDFQLGLLNGFAFAVFYSVLGLPVARLAERFNRVRIIAIATGVWTVMAMLCGMAQSYVQLILARIGVGAGEAGFNPPVASLVGDYFPGGQRGLAMAIIGLGGAVGPVIGAWGGGLIAEAGGWRAAFIIIALPGLLLAPLAWFTLREPARGAADGAIDTAPPPPVLTAMRELFAKRAFRFLIAGSALAGFTLNSFGQFMAPLFVRNFGLSLAEAGMYFGIISAISFTGGLLLGGFGADWLGRRDRRWQFWAPAVALLLAVPCYELGLFAQTAFASAALLTAGSFFLLCYYAPALASIQDLAPPRSRASAAFVAAFVSGMVGSGLGPAASGLLSDVFARAAFAGDFAASCPSGLPPTGAAAALELACMQASADGVIHSLAVICLALPCAALLFLLGGRSFPRELYRSAA